MQNQRLSLSPVVRPLWLLMSVLCLVMPSVSAGTVASPVVTATKDDGVPAATQMAAGSTITYTNTITNSGGSDATGVAFNDPDVTHTTLVPGSVKITPIAFDDTYAVVGNTQLVKNAAGGLLANDIDLANGNNTGLVVKSGSVLRTSGTMTGSTFNVNADGSFDYLPGLGLTGTETFQYTITNSVANGSLDSVTTGFVTFSVSGRVWYAVAGGTGDGRSTTPSGSPSAMSTAATASTDFIYVFSNASVLNGAFALGNGVSLIGEGVALVVNATTLRNAGSTPVIANSGGDCVTLGSGNTLSGFNVGNTSGKALVGASVGTLSASSVAINTTGAGVDLTGTASPAVNVVLTSLTSSGGTNSVKLTTLGGTVNLGSGALNGASGNAFDVNGGTATVSYSGTITGSARAVNIVNKTGGTVTLSGQVSSSGAGATGVNLASNTGATINFTGGLSLSTAGNDAFTATGGGTVSATQNNSTIINTVATTTGQALKVTSTTIGASGLTFRSISSNGGGNNGITLDTTGANAGLTVTGVGATPGSGGTIQNKTGADGSTSSGIGIYLNSTSGVSLNRMQLNGFQNFGIRGTNVTGFSLTNSTINGVNGTTEAGGSEEGAIRFDGLFTSGSFPTAQITGSTVQGGYSVNVRVQNTTGTLNRLLIDNCTLGPVDPSATHGGSSVLYDAASGATFNWTISNSSFTASRSHMLIATQHGGSRMDAIVSTNNFVNAAAAANILSGAAGILLQGGDLGAADLSFNITGNNISTPSGAKGAGITIFKATNSTSGTFDGTIASNNIGVVGQTLSGASNSAPAIWIQDHGAGTFNTLIQNNIIVEYGEEAIDLQGTGTPANLRTSILNASVFGNIVTPNATNAFCGLNIEQGAVAGDAGTMNIVVGNANGASSQRNNFQNGDPSNFTDIQILRVGTSSTVLNLSRNGSASATPTLVLQDNNIGGAATSVGDFSPGNRNLVNTLPILPTHLMFAMGGVERAAAGETEQDSDLGTVATPVSIASTNEEGLAVGNSQPVPTVQTAVSLSKAATAPEVLTQAQLDSIVSAAVARWEATELTKEQLARLRSITFEVTDLPGWYLGEANGTRIRVDGNAGGNGWYVDASPESDALFAKIVSPTRRYSDPASAPAGRIDLLSAVLHEYGHALGLCDSYRAEDRDSIMFGNLTKGERRFPAQGQAIGAHPDEDGVTHFLAAPISIGTLPAGKSVVITYDVQIESPILGGATQISSQGTVSGGNFANVLTDDPSIVGTTDQTVTLLIPPPSVTGINPANGPVTGGQSVTITGTGFTGATDVTIGGTSATGITVVSATSITATTPAGSVGTASVVVTTLSGSSTANTLYTYFPLPTVTLNSGDLAQNAPTLIIAGTNFSTTPANNTVVLSSGTATVTAATATQLTCTLGGSPSLGSLTADVTVFGGSSGATQVATIVAPPTVTLNSGDLAQNAPTLIIAGTNFSTTPASNTVALSSGTATVTAATATQLTCTLGGSPSLGSLAAVVTSNGGDSGAAVQVANILAAPTVTTNTANLAQSATQLIIAGTDFSTTAANNTVVLSSGTATVTIATATQLTCTLGGSLSLGSLTAVVTSNGGDSGVPVQVATVIPPPTVTVSTANLLINAPTITIAGTNFNATTPGDNTVAFNNGAVGTVTAATATQLTVTFSTQPAAVGSLTASVTNSDGSSGAPVQVANILDIVSIAATTPTAVEGGATGLYTFTRLSSSGNQTVNFQLAASSTATAGTDFNLTSSGTLAFDTGTGAGTLVIPDGQTTATATLTAFVETTNSAEASETARLNIVPSAGFYQAGTPPSATVSISANGFLVTTTADSGSGSLRQAILNANSIAGTDAIGFNIAGGAPYSIQPTKTLPAIRQAVIIDGSTQPGYAGAPLIELNGSLAGKDVNGLTITSGGSTVRGLVINRFALNGIRLQTGGGNKIEGNFFGTDVAGTSDLGNMQSGILIINSAKNTIGGTTAVARNVISGNNARGVMVSGAGATGNLVQGNYIGTDVTGALDLGNTLSGVLVTGAPANTIGGTTAGARNVISGNGWRGVYVYDTGATGNLVHGNYIGTDFTGTANLGNGLAGVQVTNATSNSIGGTATGMGNTIAFNGRHGVLLTGSGTGNSILNNSVFSNTRLGIDLSGNGVTPNDVNDPDTGTNNLQNFPVIASVALSGANLSITYSVPSIAPNSTFPIRVEFFIADASNREGKTFLGSDTYSAPGSKLATIPAGTAILGTKIVATATDNAGAGSTSEFSASATVVAAPAPALLAFQVVAPPANGKSKSDSGNSDKTGLAIIPTTMPRDTSKTLVTVNPADGLKYLTLVVTKEPGTAGQRRVVEVSSNLVDWTSGRNHTTVLRNDATVLEVRDNTPLTPGTKRYIRLHKPAP